MHNHFVRQRQLTSHLDAYEGTNCSRVLLNWSQTLRENAPLIKSECARKSNKVKFLSKGYKTQISSSFEYS